MTSTQGPAPPRPSNAPQQQQQQQQLAPRGPPPGLRTPSNRKTIYDRNLNRTRTAELSRASFAYLFSEMVTYAQRRVTGIQDLEKRSVRPSVFLPSPPLPSQETILSPSSPLSLNPLSTPKNPPTNAPSPPSPNQPDSTRKATRSGSGSSLSSYTATRPGRRRRGPRGSCPSCNSCTARCGDTSSGGRRTRSSTAARKRTST